VLDTNEAAVALYERNGFQREGVLRAEFIIDGAYVDDVIMARYLDPAAR
jgi:RimJ/RimL family protein N-acetyltransferase